jgi:hypothetical protein
VVLVPLHELISLLLSITAEASFHYLSPTLDGEICIVQWIMPTENDTVRKYAQYFGLFNAITSLKEAVDGTSISGLTRKYRIAAERLHSSARLCLGAFPKRYVLAGAAKPHKIDG